MQGRKGQNEISMSNCGPVLRECMIPRASLPQVHVWIRRDLLKERCFGVGDCFPARSEERVELVREIRLGEEKWKHRRKAVLL
jgi:hypothetical protein